VFVPAATRVTQRPSSKDLGRWFYDLREAAIKAGIPVPPNLTLYFFRHAYFNTGLEVESVEGISAAGGNSPQVLLSRYEATRRKRIREVADAVAKARRSQEG
jgi:hypothetical protein